MIEKMKILKKDHFLIMILAGILFLVIMWPAEKNEKTKDESGLWDNYSDILETGSGRGERSDIDTTEEEAKSELAAYTTYLETKLSEAVRLMDGAGQTKVVITLRSSAERIVEKDSPIRRSGSTEVDAAGGSRNTHDIETGEQTIFYTDTSGRNVPYVRLTIQPLIEGVLVVTEGGDNEIIVRNITDAIKALFGVDEHKIKIVKMKSGIQ